MLPKIQPALSDYYSDNAAPLSTRIFSSIWNEFFSAEPNKSKTIQAIPKILDLGKAQPDSFNFYSEHKCYLTIADCIPALTCLSLSDDGDPELILINKIKKILPVPTIQYDLILAWDSFNYIQPKVLFFINNHLLSLCTNKTIVHGFLFTSENYPKEPGTFKILDAEKIQHTVTTNKEIQHSPLTPLALNKTMPNFRHTRSVLMRGGLQEFMLSRK